MKFCTEHSSVTAVLYAKFQKVLSLDEVVRTNDILWDLSFLRRISHRWLQHHMWHLKAEKL